MEKCKRIEIRLEAMIQLIQSFLSEEEAARTTLISKSWYNAWQTRPLLVLRNLDWRSSGAEFSEFAVKTMRRYQDSNLKIESFSLKLQRCTSSVEPLARRLIVDAMKLGATDLNIEFILPKFVPTTFVLPAEVVGSESLLRLSVSGCEIDGNVKCSMLKSLSLDLVLSKSDDMLGIITSCCKSIEELSLSNSKVSLSNPRRTLSSMNLHQLHKLKRLYLEEVNVDYCFFYDLESRFPCLEDMSLVGCFFWIMIHVTSSSLRRISIVRPYISAEWDEAMTFEVPNLAVFSYSVWSSPYSISIKAREEWESNISIDFDHFPSSSCYRRLLKLLNQLSRSRINLIINIVGSRPCTRPAALNDIIRLRAKAVAVENLRLDVEYDVGRILRCLFCICRPKLVTHCWLDPECWKSDECGWKSDEHSFKNLCEKLMGSKRRRNMFKLFDLKEGKVEVCEEDEAEWRPLLLQDAIRVPPLGRKVRFHLKW